jgi:ubiquitin carboxyl-terminal hydrolase 1
MDDSYDHERAFRAFNDRHTTLETRMTVLGSGSTPLVILAGIYFVFKALEALGYPVWLWAHMAAEKIGYLLITMVQRGRSLLGGLFRLDATSLVQRGVRGLSTITGPSGQPPGLGNLSNSCFQNSVIQGLASLPSLRDYLAKTTAENRAFSSDTTNGALFDIIRQLNNPNHPGGHFWIRGKLKNMSTFQQQDAQEYYSKILDALDKEVLSTANSKRRSSSSWLEIAKSLVDVPADKEGPAIQEPDEGDQTPPEQPKMLPNPLDGLLAQRVGCVNCGYSEGLQLIPFNCLTVSLGQAYNYDIRDCLDEYTALEYIEGVECAKCTLLKNKKALSKVAGSSMIYAERLQAVEEALLDDDFDDKTLVKKFNIPKKNWTTTTKSRQAVIARAPKALVMHVNRSIFNEYTGDQEKNNAHVAYPSVLDLGDWCLGKHPSETNAPDNATEEWPRNPTKSMLGDAGTEPVTDSPFRYRLRAAVTHTGTHGYGHYICYRPHPKKPEIREDEEGEEEGKGEGGQEAEEQWWRFSDESVWAVSEEQAHQGNVFMLFYERIDEPVPSAPIESNTPPLNTLPVHEGIPLPPAEYTTSPDTVDATAADIPLPEDDDDSFVPDLVPVSASIPPSETQDPYSPFYHDPSSHTIDPIDPTTTSAYPIPSVEAPSAPSTQPSTTPSEADSVVDSEDTQDTSSPTSTGATMPVFDASQLKRSPHLMRTAGDSPQGNRTSLPMVRAT